MSILNFRPNRDAETLALRDRHDRALEDLPRDILTLPSGRPVFNTRKVLIGIRHGEPQVQAPRVFDWNKPAPPMSVDAERIQQALLDDAGRDWLDNPVMLAIGAIVLVGTVAYSATHPWGWW